MSEQGILNESAVPSGISDPAVNPAIDQPQVPATNVAVSSLPQPLTWLFNIKDPKSRLVRWRLELEEYDYTIIYKPGRVNANADALSRNPIVTYDLQKQDKSENSLITSNYNIGILSSNEGIVEINKTNNKNIKDKKNLDNNNGSNQSNKITKNKNVNKNTIINNNGHMNKSKKNSSNLDHYSDQNRKQKSILKRNKSPQKKKDLKFKCYEDFVESNFNVLKIYQNTNIQEVEIPIKNFNDNLVLRLTKDCKSNSKITNEILKEIYQNTPMNLCRFTR